MGNYNYLILTSLLFLLFLILNTLINYIAHRDGEKIPPLYVKLWLIPTLSMFIIVPILGFTFIYGMFFYSIGEAGGILKFNKIGDNFIFSLMVMLGFIFFQTIVHPIILMMLRFWYKRDVSFYTKQIVTILSDSFIIYWFSEIYSGVYIKDFYAAISISVFYHIFEWIFMVIYWLYKKNKQP